MLKTLSIYIADFRPPSAKKSADDADFRRLKTPADKARWLHPPIGGNPRHRRTLTGSLFALALLCLTATAVAQSDRTVPHAWEAINYIEVPVPNAPGKMMSMHLTSSLSIRGIAMDPKSARLRFDLTLALKYHEGIPDALAKPGKIQVEMHLPDGTVVPADASDADNWTGMSSGPGWSPQLMFFFPWTRNALDEAWIEVNLPGQTYWAEVPYGYTRDPRQPLKPDQARYGPPQPALAMHHLPAGDRLVPWTAVEYNLGTIQHDWRLAASIGNPYDSQAEIDLQASNLAADDLTADKVHTGIEIGTDGPLGSVWSWLVNMHWGGPSRAGRRDSFLFNRNPPGDKVARGWGKARITVEGKVWECTVPSSLFCCEHGGAKFNEAQRLPAPSNPFLH